MSEKFSVSASSCNWANTTQNWAKKKNAHSQDVAQNSAFAESQLLFYLSRL